jgi:transposase
MCLPRNRAETRKFNSHHALDVRTPWTFAWLNRCRRLSVDREKPTRSAEAMIRLAMIHLMLNRLCPDEAQPEFCYRQAA